MDHATPRVCNVGSVEIRIAIVEQYAVKAVYAGAAYPSEFLSPLSLLGNGSASPFGQSSPQGSLP